MDGVPIVTLLAGDAKAHAAYRGPPRRSRCTANCATSAAYVSISLPVAVCVERPVAPAVVRDYPVPACSTCTWRQDLGGDSICVDRSLDQGNRTRVQKGAAADS